MSELLKSMTARVVGVSFDNDDGTSRQDIISGLSVGEALLLNYHEYENEPAYAVTDALGNCIGHVSKELAATIYQKYKDCYFAVSVDGITGGDSSLKYGCVISIDIYMILLRRQTKMNPRPLQRLLMSFLLLFKTQNQARQFVYIVQCSPLSVLCLSSSVLFYC